MGNRIDPLQHMNCIRKIAEKGWLSTRCYTVSPQCVPARASWITGMYPSQLGITRNCPSRIPHDAPSIIRNLKRKGWYATLVGKTHWTEHNHKYDLRKNEELLRSLGFDEFSEIAGPRALRHIECELTDEWKNAGVYTQYKEDMLRRYSGGLSNKAWKVRPTILDLELYPDIWVTQKAKDYLRNMPTNKPWILWVSYVGPHEPFDTPEPWSKLRLKTQNPIPKLNWVEALPESCEQRKLSEKWGDKLNNLREIAELRTDYINRMILLDNQVSELENSLKGRVDHMNTAICITSDHGEMLGDAGMLYKGSLLESSINIPFIYKEPDYINFKTKERTGNHPCTATDLLNGAINNLKRGGKAKRLIRQIGRRKHVTIEYGNEIAIIKGDKKIVMSIVNGEPYWATNLLKDPTESRNALHDGMEDWKELIGIGKKEINDRKREQWLWRDIKL